MKYDLKGKVIVLTGAAGFLGQHYCEAFKELGAIIVGIDIDLPVCVLDNIDLGLIVNITNKSSVDNAFISILKIYDRIDILINNAAAKQTTNINNEITEFEEFPLQLWQQNLNVNLTGMFLCSQNAIKIMKKQGFGNILNIGSVYGVVGADQRIYGDSKINSSVAYATTKGGVINFTRYLAAYLQGTGIRVNCLSPGGVFNNQDPEFIENYEYRTMLKRMAMPEDIVNAALYLITDASAWVTGFNLIVDGGWTAW